MKDYSVKQSVIIVAVGCVLLLTCLYIFSPLFGTGAQPAKSLVRLVPQPKLMRTRPSKCL